VAFIRLAAKRRRHVGHHRNITAPSVRRRLARTKIARTRANRRTKLKRFALSSE